MDDGVLNTLVVKAVTRRTFLKFVGPYSKGDYHKFPHAAHCSTPKVIRIQSDKPDIVRPHRVQLQPHRTGAEP